MGTSTGALGTRLCTQGCGASLGQHRAPQAGNKSLAFSDLTLGAAPHHGKNGRPCAAFPGCSVSPVPWPRTCDMAFDILLIYILSVTQVSGRKQSGYQFAVRALLFTHLLQPHQRKAIGKQSSQIKIPAPILGKSRRAPVLSWVRFRSPHSEVYLLFPAIGVEAMATNSVLGSLQSNLCQQNFTK